MKKTIKKTNKFESVSIHLASPEDILSWSFGEVTKPETINYRTQRSERDGLFCPKIFGTEEEMACSCGKYKGMQYHGIECDKCGVTVTHTSVRRERMGHIELATPVAHYWYLKKIPSRVATLLGLPTQQLQNVVYYSSYYVSQVDEKKRKQLEKEIKEEFESKVNQAEQKETKDMFNVLYQERIRDLGSIEAETIIDEKKYERLHKIFPDLFVAEKGGEVIYGLLKNLNLPKTEKNIIAEMEVASAARREKLQKQLVLIRQFIQSGNKPEWMFMKRIPVIPPGVRPVVALDGGRYASSDLNDLYRLIIVRNNQLKDFIEIKAPQIFINTQKRLLQEAVDALFDKNDTNTQGSRVGRSQKRDLKPIAEYISGKSGYFRSNLLGKRVDFTGRTVIVVGPHLRINEFGLPKKMALEIFRPFIIGEILNREIAHNVRAAQQVIESGAVVVWEILENVMVDKYMLLNRAPTLHRQGLQAFKPILVEGFSIELHPLVCEAYNADFDGDTMVVHLPLSYEAQEEAREVLVSSNNVIKPASGEINAAPSKDMVLGCYWATTMLEEEKESVRYFGSVSEAITAYDFKAIDFQSKIKVLLSVKEKYGDFGGKLIETTVGRLLFNNELPKEYPFVNITVRKKDIEKIVQDIYYTYGKKELAERLDAIKNFGFKYASKSGITFSWDNLKKPGNKREIIAKGYEKVAKVKDDYNEGIISLGERRVKNIEIWQEIKALLSEEVKEGVGKTSSVGEIIKSGARGSFEDLVNMVAMFGVVESATGQAIEHPILSSLKEGMTPIEYFNASFGARKGIADTALKTADAGYLSRKLFDVAQEVFITGIDCKTTRGYTLYRKTGTGAGEQFSERIFGRYVTEDIVGAGNKVLVKKNHLIERDIAKSIDEDKTIEQIHVRSPIGCRYARGICAKCYGIDKTTGELVDIGEPVGTIAAQSIGEPGTQLTMRTFHTGGVASAEGDITQGLPRVTEIFERRIPKAPAVIAHIEGIVESIEEHPNGNKTLFLKTDKKVSSKDTHYNIPLSRFLEVDIGDAVKKGDFLTDGSADLGELLIYQGKKNTQEYIFNEVNKPYELLGVNISSVHFEIIIKQMFSRMLIQDPGDSKTYIADEVIEFSELTKINDDLEVSKQKQIKVIDMVSGISNISVSRNNFLSAASFQNTTNVLIRSAIAGSEDELDGIKENVIVGRLVPIGTGFEGSKKNKLIEKVKEEVAEKLAEKAEKEA